MINSKNWRRHCHEALFHENIWITYQQHVWKTILQITTQLDLVGTESSLNLWCYYKPSMMSIKETDLASQTEWQTDLVWRIILITLSQCCSWQNAHKLNIMTDIKKIEYLLPLGCLLAGLCKNYKCTFKKNILMSVQHSQLNSKTGSVIISQRSFELGKLKLVQRISVPKKGNPKYLVVFENGGTFFNMQKPKTFSLSSYINGISNPPLIKMSVLFECSCSFNYSHSTSSWKNNGAHFFCNHRNNSNSPYWIN